MTIKQSDKIEWLVVNLEGLARSYYISRVINKHLPALDYCAGSVAPYLHLCNTLVGDVAVKWCMVFGSNSEEMHWKGFVQDESKFRVHLLSEANISGSSEESVG